MKFHREYFSPTRDLTAEDVKFSFDTYPTRQILGTKWHRAASRTRNRCSTGIDQEDRRAGPADRAVSSIIGLDVPADPEHGLLRSLRRIRRTTAEGRHAGEAQQPANRQRALRVPQFPRRTLRFATRPTRITSVAKPAVDPLISPSPRTPTCGCRNCAPQRVPDCPVAEAAGRTSRAERADAEDRKDRRVRGRVRRHQQPASTAGQA